MPTGIDSHQDDHQRPPSGEGNTILPRPHRRAERTWSIPTHPSIRHHTIRLVVATAIGLLLMVALLLLALSVNLLGDWLRDVLNPKLR